MDELPPSGAETGTDRLGRDVETTLVLVTEEGAEDTLSAENAASILLLVCLDAIENARKTAKASERIKTRANCRTNAQIRARNCATSRASTRHLTLSKDPYLG